MKQVVFWDVDTQYDFIMPDGKLCIPGAVNLLPNLARLTRTAQSRRDRIQVVASMCDHEESDSEISAQPDFRETFPPHCLRGSVGQMKVLSTEPLQPWTVSHEKLPTSELQRKLETLQGEIVILKKMFDVFSNPNAEPIVKHLDPVDIYLYGVALDVCDAHAIHGLLRLGRRNIYLVRDATEAIDRARGNQLVQQWVRQGVVEIKSDDVIRKFES